MRNRHLPQSVRDARRNEQRAQACQQKLLKLGLGDPNQASIITMHKGPPKKHDKPASLGKYTRAQLYKAPYNTWRIAVRVDQYEGTVVFSHPYEIRVLPKEPPVKKDKRGFMSSPKAA
ncbi:MAG: hypothetical protein AB1489_17540 [Acidobacteriota bacterium]